MIKHFQNLMLISACLLLCAGFASAEDSMGTSSVFDLELDELIDLKISVASKSSEELINAPGIVNVITRKEIDAFGSKTLADILNRCTSMYFLGADNYFFNQVNIRGMNLKQYDTHTLILLNGRPLRDNLTGGWNAVVYNSFPVEAIDHIEIIRGPGSVLYGSNAYAGVISIITKKPPSEYGGTFQTTYGSFSTKANSIQAWLGHGDFDAMVTLKTFDEHGDNWKWTDTYGQLSNRKMPLKHNTFLANINYKDFSFNTILSESIFPWESGQYHPHPDDQRLRQYFIDVGYVNQISDTLKANFNITYNQMIPRNEYGNEIGEVTRTTQSKDFIYEANIQGEITESINFIFGGLIERNAYWVPAVAKGRSTHHSLYFQADYKPFDWLKLIAGGQMNKPEEAEYNISPRAGIVININDNWSTKFLYSEAFRSASPFETHFEIPGIISGEPGLSPETIKTYEAQLNYNNGNFNASLTAYKSDMDSLIGREGFPINYLNQRGHRFEGIELEGKYVLDSNWSFIANTTWQDNRSDDAWEAPFPTVMAKGGIMFHDNNLTVGIYNSFFEAPQFDYNAWAPDPTFRPNPDPKSYNLLTANIKYDMSSLLNMEDETVVLSVYGDNLLNEDVWYSKFDRYDVNSIPLRNGPGVFGTLAITF